MSWITRWPAVTVKGGATRRVRTKVTAVATVSCLLALLAQAPASSTGFTVNASVHSWAFLPPTVYVGTGDTITWTNADGGDRMHTVTSSNPSFDSGPIAAGQTFSYAYGFAGQFTVKDTLVPSEINSPGQQVIVQSSSALPNIYAHDGQTDRGSPCRVEVHLGRASSSPVTVHWTTKNGSAVVGKDYTKSSGTLTFTSPSQLETILVPTRFGASTVTYFSVILDSPSNATIVDGTASCGIFPGT